MESKIVKWFKVGKILQRKLDVSINPDSELLLWGPVQFKPFYGLDLMLTIFNRFPKTYKGYFWPKTLVLFTKDYKGLWINEISDVRKNGGKLFNDLILDDVKSYKIKEDWNESRDKVLEALKGIDKINLSELPNKELVKIWKDFLLLYLKFMEHSIVPEMANYASDHILENELKKIIPKEEIKNVMEVLTAPEEPSFYQEEEIQLSETEDIENHLKNHYWLKNGYDGVVNLDKEFFLERKKSINLNIRKTIEEYFKNTKEKKLELKNKYNIPENIMKIAFLTQDNILWQDKRKKVILMVIPYLNKFLEETIKRTKYSFEDLINLTSDHLISILEGNNLDNIINERKNGFGYYINRDNFRILNSEEMNEYWKKFTNKKIPENIHEFSGIIASKGKNPVIRGKVKIIFDPKLSNDFNENEILVTTMTSPEYVFLMKRSSAIITDYGGLTSHAAIVSRELEKPCIVGTKYATSVLKDGDLVEVDANLGMVRIIEKNKEKKDNVKWIKQLTRENTLLDRSLRTIAYAKSVEELGKAKMAKSPVVGFGKITSFYSYGT